MFWVRSNVGSQTLQVSPRIRAPPRVAIVGEGMQNCIPNQGKEHCVLEPARDSFPCNIFHDLVSVKIYGDSGCLSSIHHTRLTPDLYPCHVKCHSSRPALPLDVLQGEGMLINPPDDSSRYTVHDTRSMTNQLLISIVTRKATRQRRFMSSPGTCVIQRSRISVLSLSPDPQRRMP